MSVVVNKFNVFGAAVRPSKAEPILIIDANAVLSGPITAQRLQAVTGRNPEVVELVGDLELPQLAASHSLEGLKARDRPTAGEGSGVGASEKHSSATQNDRNRSTQSVIAVAQDLVSAACLQ
jgi:hypothetical protein